MIHIDLSIDPHSKHCTFGPDLKPTEDSRPPHDLIQKEFEKAQDAIDFVITLGLYEEDFATILDVLQACEHGEYVGVELELREQTGKEYTSAVLDIEGRQDPDWQLIKDETERAMRMIDTDGSFKDAPGADGFRELLDGAYAAANNVLQHREPTSGVGWPE